MTEPEPQVIVFEEGIPGFPDVRRFVLTDIVPDGVFQILQCIDDPDVSLVVAVPWIFFPDYAPELSDLDQEGLELEREEDAVVFCSVRVDPEGHRAYMNLLGPFIVNKRTLKGRQIVLTDSDHPLRAPLPLAVV